MKTNGTPKIDKGIPIPERSAVGRWKFMREMKPGDSFLVTNVSERASVGSAAHKCGFKITTRKEGDTIRVWRVK